MDEARSRCRSSFFFVCGEMGHGRETCVSPTRGGEFRAHNVDALDDRQPTHAVTRGGAESTRREGGSTLANDAPLTYR